MSKKHDNLCVNKEQTNTEKKTKKNGSPPSKSKFRLSYNPSPFSNVSYTEIRTENIFSGPNGTRIPEYLNTHLRI